MKTRQSLIIFIIFAALTAVGGSVWTLICPNSSDDMFYKCVGSTYESFWGGEEDDITGYSQAFDALTAHYTHSGRLANSLHILFQPLPKWIEDLFLGIVLTVMYVLLVIYSETDRQRRGLTAMLAVIMLWAGLPWNDNFQAQAYKINYLLPSAAIYALLYLWPRIASMSRTRYAAVTFLALLPGWLHEGFGVIIVTYALVMSLWLTRGRRYFGVVAAIALGCLINVLLGTGHRVFKQVNVTEYSSFSSLIITYTIELWPLWLAIAMTLTAYVMQPTRRKDLLRRFLPLFAAAFAGLPAAIISALAHRSLWPTLIFTFPIILYFATSLLSRLPRRLLICICYLGALAYAAWLIQLCRWEARINTDIKHLSEMLEPRVHKDISVYHLDMTLDDHIPPYLMGVVYQPMQKVHSKQAMFSYYNRELEMMAVATEDTKGVPPLQWHIYPGGSGLTGTWPSLFAPDSVVRQYRFHFGAPSASMPLSDRLMSLLKYGSADTITIVPVYWLAEVYTSTGDTVYSLSHIDLPRTARFRPLLAIDTVP